MALRLPPPLEKTESPLEGRESVPRDLVLLTKKQVANLAMLDVRSVERRIEEGVLRTTRLGSAVRVSVEDYRSWVDSGRPTSRPKSRMLGTHGSVSANVRGSVSMRDVLTAAREGGA